MHFSSIRVQLDLPWACLYCHLSPPPLIRFAMSERAWHTAPNLHKALLTALDYMNHQCHLGLLLLPLYT